MKEAQASWEKDTNWYFAYGTNLNPEEMRGVAGDWLCEVPASLDGYNITFNQNEMPCIVEDEECTLYGVAYLITEKQLKRIDTEFGAPRILHREMKEVKIPNGSVEAIVYGPSQDVEFTKPPKAIVREIIQGLQKRGYSMESQDMIREASRAPLEERKRQALIEGR